MSIMKDEPLYPLSARPANDPRTVDGKKGSETSHSLLNNNESIFDIAHNKVSNKQLKNADAPTIGSQQFDNGKSATDFTKGFDPKNLSGAIPFALSLIKDIQTKSGAGKLLGDIVTPEISSLIQKFVDALKIKDEKKLNDAVNAIKQIYENMPTGNT